MGALVANSFLLSREKLIPRRPSAKLLMRTLLDLGTKAIHHFSHLPSWG